MFPRTLTQADTSDTTFLKVITSSSTIHTKGAWVQLHAATPFNGYLLEVFFMDTRVGSTDTSSLLDIGIDPAGGTAYTVLVPNLLAGHAQSSNLNGRYQSFPVYIPAGSTVAARLQSIIASHSAEVAVRIHGGITGDPFPTQGLVVDYGTATASSSGTTPANAAANTKGAWVQLTASTTHPHRGLTIQGQGADGVLGNFELLVDIGIGAASSEVVLIENWWIQQGPGEQCVILAPNPLFWRPIPEGSRLAVRAQAEALDLQENFDIAVYGWGS